MLNFIRILIYRKFLFSYVADLNVVEEFVVAAEYSNVNVELERWNNGQVVVQKSPVMVHPSFAVGLIPN